MSGPTLHLALTRPLRFAASSLVALGLTVGAAGSALAFPKPKYATSVQTPAPAPSTPPPAAGAADDSDPAIPDRSTPKASTAKPTAAKATAAKPAVLKPSAVAAAPKPAVSAPPATGGWSIYQVRPGDTLTGVGRRFGANAKTLSDLNELEPKAPLKTGMKIKLPPGTVDKGRDPYATGPAPTTLSDVSAPAPNHLVFYGKPKSAKPATTGEAAATPTTPAQAEPYRSRPTAAEARATPAAVSAAEPGASPLPVRSASTPDPALPRGAEAWTPRPAQVAKADPTTKAPSEAVASGRGRFVWPVKGEVVTRFGPLGPGQRNDGVNIAAGEGARVEAAAAGEVVYAGSSLPGFGNLVLLKHADGWVTAYAHLASISVRMRDHVAQGQPIGVVGQTGGVDRPQLHFEARFAAQPHEKARPIDPLALLPQ